MLLSLSLSEFVIVPSLCINLQRGFTALTGETGAGKSILIDALQLLLGARTDTSVIREGAPKTEVSAIFSQNKATRHWLQENGFNAEEDILLRRTIDISGRSHCWICGSPATAGQMRALGEKLVDIHGQLANQSLLKSSEQLRLLDAHGGLFPLRLEVRKRFDAWANATEALRAAKEKASGLQQEMERLLWMQEDLEALAPSPGEWEQVNEEHRKLANANDIIEGTGLVSEILESGDDSVLDRLGTAYQKLVHLGRFDTKLESIAMQLSDASSIVSDAAGTLRQYVDATDLNEERFAALDRRLSAYYDTARKFRVQPEDLAGLREKVARDLTEISSGIDTSKLEEAQDLAKQQYLEAARSLSARRKEAAAGLSADVTQAMQKLAMAGGCLAVRLAPASPSRQGLETCEFLVAGHAGVQPKPLAKTASGGELSRISLAIAVITSRVAPVGTLIFDEVDAGIGGGVAEVVGRLLQKLGQDRQVLCVTHQPQVASCADGHLAVEKHTAEGITTSSVHALGHEQRIREIARMLGGIRITEATLIHATEMLANSAPTADSRPAAAPAGTGAGTV